MRFWLNNKRVPLSAISIWLILLVSFLSQPENCQGCKITETKRNILNSIQSNFQCACIIWQPLPVFCGFDLWIVPISMCENGALNHCQKRPRNSIPKPLRKIECRPGILVELMTHNETLCLSYANWNRYNFPYSVPDYQRSCNNWLHGCPLGQLYLCRSAIWPEADFNSSNLWS